MKLITISGLDGSGKSTQIELLKNYLESQGKKVFYFHAVEFSLANKLSKSTGKKESRSATKSSWLAILLRKIFLKIDLWRFNRLIRKLKKEDYDYLVSDRYFYDSMINIEYLEKKSELNSEIPNADLPIYLQVFPKIIMQRERVPDQGLEYLQEKEKLYDAKISDWNMKVIDGSRDKEEVFEEIKNILP